MTLAYFLRSNDAIDFPFPDDNSQTAVLVRAQMFYMLVQLINYFDGNVCHWHSPTFLGQMKQPSWIFHFQKIIY